MKIICGQTLAQSTKRCEMAWSREITNLVMALFGPSLQLTSIISVPR